MAKRLLVLALLAAAWATAGAGAQSLGTPDAYKMTFNEFQLCKNADFTDCTPSLGTPLIFDIGTASPGDSIGSFAPFTSSRTSTVRDTFSACLLISSANRSRSTEWIIAVQGSNALTLFR